MPIASQPRRLRKELSLFNVYTIATGATLSSGFFLLPGLAAVNVGPAVILSYLLAVLPLLPGILSKIELATAMPKAGGEYYFLDRSLGPMVGTIAGLGTWCGLVLKTAFALIGIAAYLGVFFPHMQITPWVIGSAIVFGVINLLGSRRSGMLQGVLVLGLLLLLFWFIATGVFGIRPEYTRGMFDHSWHQILSASGLVCVSFMGLTNVASVAEEVKDPERNLTLGIFLALGTSILVYALGTYVIVGVVPPEILYLGDVPSLTPVADAASEMAGPIGAATMTVAALLACLSVGNAGILSASRYPLAMSRDHLLPAWFRVLNRHDAPQNGIFVTLAMILILVTLLDPTAIAKLASAFLLLLFALNCLAVMVMRESRIDSYDPGFRSPGYPWVQIVGIIAPLGLIAVMGWLPVLFTAAVIAIGAAWYRGYARRRVNRSGAVYHLFARLGQHRFEGLDRELRGILKEKGVRQEDPYDQVVATARAFDAPGQVSFEQVVHQAANMLATDLPVSSQHLESKFMEGTRVGATPTACGVALPHLRLAGIRHPVMVLARTSEGVHVEVAADMLPHGADQPIYAVFFLISPEHDAAQHLRLLAHVAQRVEDEQFMTAWLAARNEQKLKEILLREEHFLSLTLQTTTPTAEMIGRTLRDLSFPGGSLVAMINRSNGTVVPDGHTVLQEDDTLTIVGVPKSIRELRQRYEEEAS